MLMSSVPVGLRASCAGIPLTLQDRDGDRMADRLLEMLEAQGLQAVSTFLFGGCSHYARLHRRFRETGGTLAWLQGDACHDGRIYAAQCFALPARSPELIVHGGRLLGFVYEDEFARYCRLGGVRPASAEGSREAQAREVLETMAAALEAHGFRFTNTVRTWFYLADLLAWYGTFNQVRTAFFQEQGLFEGLVPASTGIGARHPHGTALVCDLLAVQPKSSLFRAESVPSPLQGSALDYRSSFSRAVEVATPAGRTLMISGTASIDREGRTAHVGDAAAQIRLTLEVVDALLKSRGMGWRDVTRGIAYFTDMEDVATFEALCRSWALPELQVACVHADICRDDLRFELELDAVRLGVSS